MKTSNNESNELKVNHPERPNNIPRILLIRDDSEMLEQLFVENLDKRKYNQAEAFTLLIHFVCRLCRFYGYAFQLKANMVCQIIAEQMDAFLKNKNI